MMANDHLMVNKQVFQARNDQNYGPILGSWADLGPQTGGVAMAGTQDAKWENWSGRQTATPTRVLAPDSQAGFVDAVHQARDHGWTIRAVGASHSHSRIAAPDGLLVATDQWQGVVDQWQGVVEQTEDTAHRPADEIHVITARAGTRIFQFGEPLYQRGLALINQGDIDKQSIAGAISTGTHGTGPTLGNISTAVAAVRVVLNTGDVVHCDAATEPDLFEVARHSLGGVGLVTEVDLRVRPRYMLDERQWIATIDEVMPHIDRLVADTRHFEFFWVPDRDLFACKSLTEVDSLAEVPTDGPSPEPEQLAKRARRGWSHKIISSIRDDKHTEMEYSVPAELGPACFEELRDMVLSRFPELQWPLEYRTVAADDLMISAASNRPTVTISAHQDITLDDRPLFTACEEIFRRYEGRPHWGKVHYQTGAELADLYPRFQQWWEIRDRYDSDEMFVTADLRQLRP